MHWWKDLSSSVQSSSLYKRFGQKAPRAGDQIKLRGGEFSPEEQKVSKSEKKIAGTLQGLMKTSGDHRLGKKKARQVSQSSGCLVCVEEFRLTSLDVNSCTFAPNQLCEPKTSFLSSPTL